VSGITLGTVQLGMEYGIANKSGKPNLEKSFKILETALAGGVNSFDTSDAYGDSEAILGEYFKTAEKPLFTTKFRIDPAGDTSKAGIEKQIFDSAGRSVDKLGIQKIPVYMLHVAQDLARYGSAVPEALKKLRDSGLIGIPAVSVYTADEAEEMLRYGIFGAIQLPINAFDRRMVRAGVIKKLKQAEIIVFARSVFQQGLFFLKPEELPRGLEFAGEALLKLKRLSESEGLSIAQSTLGYIRDMEGITSLVVGAETPEQISENIRLMETPRISERLINSIETEFEGFPIEKVVETLRNRPAS